MRKYTFPSTALILVLAGSLAIGTEQGKKQRRKPAIPPEHRITFIDDATIEVAGKRFTIPEFARKKPPAPPEPPPAFYQINPKDGDRNFPLPGGAPDVRAVLERFKPVPADRVAYFKALDNDPLSDAYPRGGWYVYVRRVERHQGGWTAEIMANVWFDHQRNANGGLPMAECWQFWVERYQWDGTNLTYLGGQPSRPGETPTITPTLK
jgi:hypothetical protein